MQAMHYLLNHSKIEQVKGFQIREFVGAIDQVAKQIRPATTESPHVLRGSLGSC